MVTKVALQTPVTNDMICWLSEVIGPERLKWQIESEFDCDYNDISDGITDIYEDIVFFTNEKDAMLFKLRWL